MFTSSSRLAGIVLTLVLFLVAGGRRASSGLPQGNAAQPEDSPVKKLLKERLTILREIAVSAEKDFRGGAEQYKGVLEAKRAALMGELDLSDTDKERIAILEKIVALAKMQEEHAVKLVKGGQIPKRDALKATVSRLEAEIALERAKAKAK
ncbi:MAG: hypothetical protein HYX68_11180 [Planctomycetes bacterium]|jgi:hypothetical protein|nr:hypothetical protein [Planctomycetota bacterium]